MGAKIQFFCDECGAVYTRGRRFDPRLPQGWSEDGGRLCCELCASPPVPAEFDYLRPALPPGVQGQGDVTVREQAPTILATEQDAAFRSRVAALEPKRARWMELADKRASYAYLRKQAEDNFRAFDPPRDPKDYEIGPHLAAGEQIELSELDKLFVGTTG